MGYCARDGSGDGKAHYFPRVNLGPTIDHVADANARLSLTAEGVVVSGAGVVSINATYTQRGISGGKPYYNPTSKPSSASQYTIVANLFGVYKWAITGGPGHSDDVLFTSDDDVDRPDLVTTWIQQGGTLPLPTVTHSPGQVTGAGYQVIQDDDGLTYTFNGDGADADAGLLVTGAGTTEDNDAYVLNSHGDGYIGVNGSVPMSGPAPLWTIDSGAYNIVIPGADYPWQAPWGTVGDTGDPPAPTVLRNPIASLANWSP